MLLIQNPSFSTHNNFGKSCLALSGFSGTVFNLPCALIKIKLFSAKPCITHGLSKCIEVLFGIADLQHCFGSLLFHIQQHAYK